MRPDRLVVVVGTGTDVGKTWVAVRLIERLRLAGLAVSARKPVQSFEPGAGPTDADLLAAASGETSFQVCPIHRWYPRAMAPPMAAEALGKPPPALRDLLEELAWPDGVDLGVIEGAGGVRSPLAIDGDAVDFIAALPADQVIVVADAGLGTLNLVTMSLDALADRPVIVYLNRFDEADELHRRNRAWIEHRLGVRVSCAIDGLVDRTTHG